MVGSGIPHPSSLVWRALVGIAFVAALQVYFGGWWLNTGERVRVGFWATIVLAFLVANSALYAKWLWIGLVSGHVVMLMWEIEYGPDSGNLFPIVIVVGAGFLGIGVALGWGARELVQWAASWSRRGKPYLPRWVRKR